MTQAQVDERRLLEEAQKAAQEVENYYHHSSQYPPLKKVTDELEKELNLDFLHDDNAVKKHLHHRFLKKGYIKDRTFIVRRR